MKKVFGFTFESPEKNGCGPWWVPVELKDSYFKSQCDLHDQDYEEGVDRYDADKIFYWRMIERVKQEPNRLVRLGRRLQALAFYHIVRRFGVVGHKEALDL